MGEPKVLAKGVDTLHVSGKGVVRADVWDQVDELRKLGELNESAEMVELLQLDDLKSAGCFRTFVDRASGALDERPELAKVLDQLRPGDTLVVWKLDRLGRSLRHLIDVVGELQRRGSDFAASGRASTPPLREAS